MHCVKMGPEENNDEYDHVHNMNLFTDTNNKSHTAKFYSSPRSRGGRIKNTDQAEGYNHSLYPDDNWYIRGMSPPKW